MKKLIAAALFGSLVSVSAMAAEDEPKVLTGDEMDKVTAGFFDVQTNWANVYQSANALALASQGSFSSYNSAYANASNYSNIQQENKD